jgi:hypothetical protein
LPTPGLSTHQVHPNLTPILALQIPDYYVATPNAVGTAMGALQLAVVWLIRRHNAAHPQLQPTSGAAKAQQLEAESASGTEGPGALAASGASGDCGGVKGDTFSDGTSRSGASSSGGDGPSKRSSESGEEAVLTCEPEVQPQEIRVSVEVGEAGLGVRDGEGSVGSADPEATTAAVTAV